MCTLSFIPHADGYIVAMNRDELLTRGAAQPAAVHACGDVRVIHPLDVSGGTWIAANSEGTTWALLNWNIGARSVKERSRGEVVLQLASYSRLEGAKAQVSAGTLEGIDPFRVVGISETDRAIGEWRWNGTQLQQITHSWESTHWFSSGKSDELAAEHRGQVFAAAAREPDAGSIDWLRRIHASHRPEKGAFSVCVHRDDAASISYTEVVVSHDTVTMAYREGSPCHPSTAIEVAIPKHVKLRSAL